MKILKVIVTLLFFGGAYTTTHAQEYLFNLSLAKESVIKKVGNKEIGMATPIGRVKQLIVFADGEKNTCLLYRFNEQAMNFESLYTIHIQDERKLFSFKFIDSILFFIEVFSDINNIADDGYNRIVIKTLKKEILLDSVFNVGKNIHSSFSSDGRYLIVNTLNELPEMYNPSQDDQFIVYDLSKPLTSQSARSTIPCKYCGDGYLMNGKLFFTKSNERDDLWGGYAWKDIYVAPWGKLKDSIKVASRTEIRAVSPDGKYIVGKRNDLPNGTCVIVDVQNKKYQLLLGRDYNKKNVFYSYEKQKFAFDFGSHIVYVDTPEDFPFNALQKVNMELWSNYEEIQEKFQHKPLE